jgi:hypothetical protein
MDENGTIVVTPLEQIKFWKLRGAPGEWASLFYLKFPLPFGFTKKQNNNNNHRT